MGIVYKITQEDINAVVLELGINPFDGDLISEETIQSYDNLGVNIDETFSNLFGESISQRYDEYVDPTQLRVFRSLSKELNPLASDFTILGFRKISPGYDRGRKTQALYKCIVKDEIIVEKIFRDVYGDDGILKELEVTFNYYDEEGNVGLTKTEVVKAFNKFEAETEHRKRRERQFDYLKASVKGTPYEFYIEILIKHFHADIQNYKDDGLFDLHTSMINETDATIRAILDSTIARNDGLGDTTVMRSMQYQIGTIPLEDL